MKVLVVPTWYPTGEDKLMGNYHKEFTEALNEFGVEANMLFIDRQRLSKPFKYFFSNKKELEQEENYRVYKYKMLNWAPISFKIQQKMYLNKLKKAYKNYVKIEGKPDIIHAHVTVPAGYAACKLGKKYNIPVIVTEHCAKLERFFEDGQFKKYGEFVLKNSQYSTVSNYMKKYMQQHTDNCIVLPNLVDTSIFNNNKKRRLEKTFRLVSVCALRDGKKIDNIFMAMSNMIKKGNKNIHLDVVGDGFFEDYYKQQCKDLKLERYVSFLGRKTKEEISEILIKEHALIISSEIESFAIPGIEALASGIPVISTKCLGPEEYINNKCGALCEVNDIPSLVSAIEKVQKNYDKYDPKYLKSVAKKFSKEEIIPNAIKIYNKLIKQNKN